MTMALVGWLMTMVTDQQDPVLDVRDLHMRYGTTDVLEGVEFSAARGEVIALLGPNGAGKTTTIEILEGLRLRSSGDVRVLGVDPAEADEDWRAGVGIMLQSWRDHGRWRVRELLRHLGSFYAPYATAERPRPRDVDQLIETVGLADRASARLVTLSGGERRRLDIAISIVGRPEVLFLDEPTAGLDPMARRGFHDLVHELADLEDTTILLATHDLDEAEKLADRILILDRGRIVANGSAGTRHAFGDAARLRGSHRDRPVLAPSGDGRRPRRLGRPRSDTGARPAAPDGPPGVRSQCQPGPGEGRTTDRVR